MLYRVALAATLITGASCLAGVALAQDAPLSLQPQPQQHVRHVSKAETKRPRPTAAAAVPDAAAPAVASLGKIIIRNHNSSTLLSLSLSPTAGGDFDTDPVAQNLQSGSAITVALPRAGVCIYNIHASFEDWSSVDVRSDNLCKDPTITLEGSNG